MSFIMAIPKRVIHERTGTGKIDVDFTVVGYVRWKPLSFRRQMKYTHLDGLPDYRVMAFRNRLFLAPIDAM